MRGLADARAGRPRPAEEVFAEIAAEHGWEGLMQLEFTRSATTDLDAIANYIARDNPVAAAIYRLVNFPEMGRVGRLPGTREDTVAGLPYLVVYHVANGVIIVLASFHEVCDLARTLAQREKGVKK